MFNPSPRLPRAGALLACAALAAACDSLPSTAPETSRFSAPNARMNDINSSATTASVSVTYASGALDTVAWSMTAGATAQLAATLRDTLGNVVTPTPATTFKSTSPTILSVDSVTGALKALAAGTANVTATISGTVGTSKTITVKAATTTITTRTIPLSVQRFDGGAGVVMVSNGIPLAKGYLTTANLSQVHVKVGSVEQPVYVRALSGKWSDSSLRAVFVQFDYDIPSTAPIAASLVIGGGSRTLPDLAARPALPVPAAAALPNDPTYLVSTRWTGVTYAAKTTAPTAVMTQFEGDYTRLEAADWTSCGPKFDCSRTAGYDRAYILYQAWQRTGNPTDWYHATAVAADYLKTYVIPNGAPTAWWSQTEGVAVHYWATGDEMSRYQLRKMAEMLAWMVRPGYAAYMGGTYGDDRFRAKAFTAAVDAWMIGIINQPADAANYYKSMGAPNTYYASYLTQSTLGTWVTALLSTQRTNGQFGGRYYSYGTWSPDSGGQSNYMVGMLLESLIRYHTEIKADTRIPPAVKKCIDDLWAREWDAPAQGFQYHSLRGTDEGGTTQAKASPQPGLNALILPAFAWYARISGNSATYRSRTDAIIAGLASPTSRNWWPYSGKAFDQAYLHLFNSFAWRAGLL
ncbi:Ig domain protein group 2 domain protein [Gemmatirosa kalamazoonensis]|uniref:Ig domain protein group 2 domain protein n=1 Tax=Gemmatirosa kalamazoonensis TaxID=861299 RepID=W0RGF1_9BACT|nr:hypothetical protein [Gemmatirosa kalamazoonensis]AHG89512.1 Ig domain protein group 2 domain protein [Gemmatirosa kalamazoonensis]